MHFGIYLPFVEIVDQANTLEMANWISGRMPRVSRDSLRAQRPSLLVLDLAKVI